MQPEHFPGIPKLLKGVLPGVVASIRQTPILLPLLPAAHREGGGIFSTPFPAAARQSVSPQKACRKKDLPKRKSRDMSIDSYNALGDILVITAKRTRTA